MTIYEPKSNEEEISSCFKAAIEKLDRVEADAEKEKTQIVKDLAKDLEGKIPTDRICNEIVHQLHGKKISPRTIRKCLDKKYKEKHRVENAQKQKSHENTKDLAAPVPLEQEKPKQQIAATQDCNVIINEPRSDTEAVSERIGTDDNGEAEPYTTNQIKSDESTQCPETDNFDGTSLLAQNKKGKRIESDLEKCPNCSVLRLQNQELEEALREATTMSTADTLHSTSNEASEILKLEYSLPYQYVQPYMAAEYKEGRSNVWFSVEIDVNPDCSLIVPYNRRKGETR
jgi:hypothetical protein